VEGEEKRIKKAKASKKISFSNIKHYLGPFRWALFYSSTCTLLHHWGRRATWKFDKNFGPFGCFEMQIAFTFRLFLLASAMQDHVSKFGW